MKKNSILHIKLCLSLLTWLYFSLLSPLSAQNAFIKSLKNYKPDLWDVQVSFDTKVKAHTALLEKATEPYEKAKLHFILCEDYCRGAVYDKSLFHNLEAEKLIAGTNDPSFFGEIYKRRGDILSEFDKLDESKAQYELSQQQFELSGDSVAMAIMMTSLAIIHSKKEAFSTSKALYDQAIAVFKNYNRKDLAYEAQNNYTVDLIVQNRPKEAIPFILEAITFDSIRKDATSLAFDYDRLGCVLGMLNEYDSAFEYYQRSIKLAQEQHAYDILYATYMDMSDTYTQKGDWKLALDYHKKYIAVKDSVVGSETQLQICELENKYKAALLTKGLEKQVFQRNILIISVFLGLLLTLILLWKLRNDRKRDKEIHANKEVLSQLNIDKKELEAALVSEKYANQRHDLHNLSLDLSRKNSFAEFINERLEEIARLPASNREQSIRELQTFVQNNQFIDKEKAVFQEKTDEVNHEYYTKLEQKFGQLTVSEKELCGFIRLNISNKDIAALKSISPASAKMARYRLRKRLGIDEEVDIVAFLQEV
jgi:tetratricopeptide (TPR) repeat protein/DNA-binding CsgD family transcriptional regulator